MDLMPAFYAAVQAVAEGQAGEIEVEHRVTDDAADREEVLAIIVRREIRPMVIGPPGGMPESG